MLGRFGYIEGANTPSDIATARRETLLGVIAEQKAIIAQLQRRIRELEAPLHPRRSSGMPGNQPSSRQRPPSKEAGKERDHGFAWVRQTGGDEYASYHHQFRPNKLAMCDNLVCRDTYRHLNQPGL
jgi:hypothetical protein